MKVLKHEAGRLELAGWSFETNPRRTLAKLREADGAVTYIGVQLLVTAPELFSRLTSAEQAEVMAMATGVAA